MQTRTRPVLVNSRNHADFVFAQSERSQGRGQRFARCVGLIFELEMELIEFLSLPMALSVFFDAGQGHLRLSSSGRPEEIHDWYGRTPEIVVREFLYHAPRFFMVHEQSISPFDGASDSSRPPRIQVSGGADIDFLPGCGGAGRFHPLKHCLAEQEGDEQADSHQRAEIQSRCDHIRD
jgi:hypothetical protein